jgi:hypothetical protein
MQEYFVYVLRSEVDQSWYIGYTSDFLKRIHEHNAGKCTTTRLKMPELYSMSHEETYRNLHPYFYQFLTLVELSPAERVGRKCERSELDVNANYKY